MARRELDCFTTLSLGNIRRIRHELQLDDATYCRADSRCAPSQWATALLCNHVSHWLDTNLKSALYCVISWSRYSSGDSPLHLILSNLQNVTFSSDWRNLFRFLKGHWQSPCSVLTADKSPLIRLCKETLIMSSHEYVLLHGIPYADSADYIISGNYLFQYKSLPKSWKVPQILFPMLYHRRRGDRPLSKPLIIMWATGGTVCGIVTVMILISHL